jgi:hypothetical protein
MNRSVRTSICLAALCFLGAGVVASCLPALHSLIGRPCDIEHPCRDAELTCSCGTCQLASEELTCDAPGDEDGGTSDGGPDAGVPDAGTLDGGTSQDAGCPPNQVLAGGSEPGFDINDHFDATGRGTISLSAAVVRTGVGAIKMTRTSMDASTYFGVELKEGQLGPLQVGALYCVSAWVQRGTTRGEISLTGRRYSASDHEDTPASSMTLFDDDWHRLLISTSLTTTFNRDITFFISLSTGAGADYYVDDIQFWEAPGTTCDEVCAP